MSEVLKQLYTACTGHEPESISSLPSSGSHRSYFRLSGQGGGMIGTVGTDADENRAFITIARHFRSAGIPVPQVLCVDESGMAYLQEDLGGEQLYDLVADGRKSGQYSETEAQMLCKAISLLPKIQHEGAKGLDFDVCYPEKAFNGRMVDFDLNYFKYCFLKTSDVEFNEARLQDDFDRLREDLLAVRAETFMYRDFQARNVMMRDGQPWFIDFQGGRKGPLHYDVASFVYQARSRFPEGLRKRLIDTYLDSLRAYEEVDEAAFRETLRIFVLFRTLQVLGAYGYRGRYEKRRHFLESIPYALDNLRELLSSPFERYPYLCEVLGALCARTEPQRMHSDTLKVDVCSFSFKKGLPADDSGNGGGYVFDCRGIHNPGRYERYKHSTGRDADVISFLEENGEAATFLEHVYAIVDAHVARYIERGFDHLQVSFGCTGGQHRSVYCAESTARHLHQKFDIEVRLSHLVQGIEEILR